MGNYWIRAAPNLVATGGTGFANGINSAILRYENATVEEPTTSQDTPSAILSEIDLAPLENPAAVRCPI